MEYPRTQERDGKHPQECLWYAQDRCHGLGIEPNTVRHGRVTNRPDQLEVLYAQSQRALVQPRHV